MYVLLKTRCGCERMMEVGRYYTATIQIPLVGDGSKVRVFEYCGKLSSGLRMYMERLER